MYKKRAGRALLRPIPALSYVFPFSCFGIVIYAIEHSIFRIAKHFVGFDKMTTQQFRMICFALVPPVKIANAQPDDDDHSNERECKIKQGKQADEPNIHDNLRTFTAVP